MSNFATCVVPQVFLTLGYCANSILVRGAVMDGAIPGYEGFIFSTSYLGYFFGNKVINIC